MKLMCFETEIYFEALFSLKMYMVLNIKNNRKLQWLKYVEECELSYYNFHATLIFY